MFKEKINSNTYAPCYSCLCHYKKSATDAEIYTGLVLFSIAVDKLFNPDKDFNIDGDYKNNGVKMATLLITEVPDSITRINRSTYIVNDSGTETMYNITHNRKRYFYALNNDGAGGDYWDNATNWPNDKTETCKNLLNGKYRIRTSTTWAKFITDLATVSYPSGATIKTNAFWYVAPKFTITNNGTKNIVNDISGTYKFITQNTYTTLRGKGISCTLYEDNSNDIYIGLRFNADQRPDSISTMTSLDKANLVRLIPSSIGTHNVNTKTIIYTHRTSDATADDEIFYLYTLINCTIKVFRISVNHLMSYSEAVNKYTAVDTLDLNSLIMHDNGNNMIGTESDYSDYINHDILNGVVTHCFKDKMYKYDIPSKQLTVTPFKLPSNITDLSNVNFGYDMMTYSDTVYVLTRGIVVTEDIQSDQIMNLINRLHYLTHAYIKLADRVALLESSPSTASIEYMEENTTNDEDGF